ncbi:MAG: MCP four helix bundle domain-containing protein [Nitrospira sp.]|nr:MCP four helix bundle domain-containing protein [Nitrospira sp.]
MSRIKDLGTKTKLMINIGLFVVIMCITTTLSIKGMGELGQRSEFIFKTNVVSLMLLGDLRHNTQRMDVLIATHILTQDSATRAQLVKDIAGLDAQIERFMPSYAPLLVSEPERKHFERFQSEWSTYKDFRARLIQLSENFSKDAASEIRKKELEPRLDILTAAIVGLVGENERQAKDAFHSTQNLTKEVTITLVLFAVGASVVGVGFGWFISRHITANLSDLLEVAQQLGRGKLDARSTVATNDEVGQLAQAFNQMGVALTQAKAKQEEAIEEMNARIDIMNTTSIVSESDRKGDIIAVNDKFCEISKYSREELLGRGHNIVRHADMPKEIFREMWHTIGQGKIFRGVIKNKAKDGTPYYVDAVIKPIMGPDGKPRKYLGVRYDITAYEMARHNMKGIVDAIEKSYATVEFSLAGVVQTANTFFLKTMGYRLDEIAGMPHTIFIEPSSAGSSEYRVLWEKLGRGEHDSNQYRYLAKSRQEVWFQACYTPVMDEVGKPFKVIMLATDITEQKQALVEVEQLIKAATVGQLSQRMGTDLFTGSSRELADGVNRLLDSVTQPLHEAQAVLNALAVNDLTKTMTGIYQGEFEQMKTSLNLALKNLATTISVVREVVDGVLTGAEEITNGNEDLAERTSQQASALEETSASMEEMTSTVKQNADNAKQANQLAVAARDVAAKGSSVTTRAVEAMSEINQSSKKIADIITVIDEIAFQTNLLALNAAVESARAGEHGRGFAVVATEVRNLARRSATAAKEIKDLIKESIQRVSEGTKLVDQSGKTLEEIMTSVKRVSDIVAEISAASQEQASGIEEVNKAIMAMDETTQQNAALVEETTSASQSMKDQAQELMRKIDVFKIMPTTGAAVAVKPSAVAGSTTTGPSLKSAPPEKSMQKNVSVGVGSARDKNRPCSSDEFEEF